MPQWRFVRRRASGAGGRCSSRALRRGIVFDLDPGEGVTMQQLCEVAHAVRDLIADIGLTTYPLTSGSKGLHLYVPLRGADQLARRVGAGQARCAAAGAGHAQAGHRDHDQEPAHRQGVPGLEPEQRAKTTIAPYSLRGREHPTVAAPRTWDEIDDPKLRHLRFDEVLERVERGRRPARGARRACCPTDGPADDVPQHARRVEDTGAGAEEGPEDRQ